MSELLNQISSNASIVILTGAGISAESGLATFRASDGLWENHRVEDVATPEAFARNPELVQTFYNQRRAGVKDVHPNPAHTALTELEKNWPNKNGGEVLVVTQNIDDLHERAGTQNLIHMHGEVLKIFCTKCANGETNEHVDKIKWHDDLSINTPCPNCKQTGGLRPDIVWFGEMPYHMDAIFDALSNCDLFISIGTSGNVYPAAGFVQHARQSGSLAIECNLEPSNVASAFHDHINGPAGETIPALVKALLKNT